jgi:hypothetical protein
MWLLICLLLTNIVFLLPMTVSAFTIPPQQPISHQGPKHCSSHIIQSFSQDYNWTSPDALNLAQCLLTHKPGLSTCVFYTRAARPLALRYAAEENLTTIYDVYPPLYFNISLYPASNWKSSGHLRDLFRITSKAYAIACSGNATLVLPEDEEPCPHSIWVTDEWEVIRSGESKIVLPVWRVSWTWDKVKGLWGWAKKVLGHVAGGGNEKGWAVGRRNLKNLGGENKETGQGEPASVMPEEVRNRLEMMKEQWGWEGGDADPWAAVDRKCEGRQSQI